MLMAIDCAAPARTIFSDWRSAQVVQQLAPHLCLLEGLRRIDSKIGYRHAAAMENGVGHLGRSILLLDLSSRPSTLDPFPQIAPKRKDATLAVLRSADSDSFRGAVNHVPPER
jgi:hypothetical protein